MGQVVKQVSSHSTRYYWYPGDKKEWLRGILALAIGAAGFALLDMVTHRTLLAAVVATSAAAGFAGFNFGRRDSRELSRFADLTKARYVRRQTAMHTGRAAWRGVVQGTGGAMAAVIIVNLRTSGVVADWLLPLVPAIVGALAHQGGMMFERMATSESTEGPAKKLAAAPANSAPAAPVPTASAPAATAPAATAPAGAVPAASEPVARPAHAKTAGATAVLTSRSGPAVAVASVPLTSVFRVSRPQFGAPASMRVPFVSAEDRTREMLRFDPTADCEAVEAARVNAMAGAATLPRGELSKADLPKADQPKADLPKGPLLSPHHAAVALPTNVSTFKHGKPPMPLSKAIAARADLAHIADALGTDSLTESHKHS